MFPFLLPTSISVSGKKRRLLGISEEKMMFVNITSDCDLGPHVEPYPLYG